ncbi:MAG: ADP-ribosylglycohydrolase family protein [Planctomycetales bacterium]|nr:ADP-ribosylglycohydrolase family protein [Planctomycetales bacterium]
MRGAIIGDIAGSVHEFEPVKTTSFAMFGQGCTFTDDTVLTAATAQAILNGTDYAAAYRDFGRRYPGRGYGGNFGAWLMSADAGPYNSWGNGSAMRVAPVGFAFDSADAVLQEAGRSAEVTHNHPEGIKGAQATALAIYLARTGGDKETIRREIAGRFGYNLNRTIEQIRPTHVFNESCQGTVPEAIIAFLDSTDFENTIRLAISLGGDSDTLACIAGGIAQAYYKEIPSRLADEALARLPEEFVDIIRRFEDKYGPVR